METSRPAAGASAGRRIVTGIGLIGAAAIIAARVSTGGPDASDAGPLLVLAHVFDLVVVLGLLAVCTAAGRFALRCCRFPMDEPIEALVFSTTIGVGITGTMLLAAGLAGGLRPPLMFALLAAIAIVARRELAGVPASLAAAWRGLVADGGPRLTRSIGAALFAAAALLLVILSLAPPVDWDSLMYHLPVPAEFVAQGQVHVPADNLHVTRIGLVHMLYVPLLAVGSTSGPALLNTFLALLLALATFSLSRRLFDAPTAGLSVGLFWGTTTILLVATTPRVDVTLTLFLLAAHGALLTALDEPRRTGRYYVAAVLLGLGVGVKFHALAYLVALAPLVLLVGLRHGDSRKTRPVAPLLFGLVVALVALPWLAKNWLLLGAPLYPFFSRPILQPWLAAIYGSIEFPAGAATEALEFVWRSRPGFNLRDVFFAPGRLSIEWEGRFYFTNPALLLLPLGVAYLRNRALFWLTVPAVAYLVLAIVPFPGTNLRYLIPAAVPLTIVVSAVIVRTLDRLAPRAGPLVPCALLVIALIPTAGTAIIKLAFGATLGHLAGLSSAERYMEVHPFPEVRSYAALHRFVNEDLPPGHRILMLFEARGWYFSPEVIQDNKATNWPLLAGSAATADCLEATGVTHVLVGVGALQYYMEGGGDRDVVRWEAFEGFAEQCLVLVFESGAHRVYQLR